MSYRILKRCKYGFEYWIVAIVSDGRVYKATARQSEAGCRSWLMEQGVKL